MHTQKLLPAIAAILPFFCFAQTAQRFDVVISEIMADPSPVVGLPNAEYAELTNVSSSTYNLNGWQLSDGNSTGTIRSDFQLQPGGRVILCTNSNVPAFSAFGDAVGVTSFPSLDNAGDVISLMNSAGDVIHAVGYRVDWYQNEVKQEGGWSLEMIDLTNACTGAANWKASNDPSGGTPGKTNSVNGSVPDDTPPQLLRTFSVDNMNLVAVFDEPLDLTAASNASSFSLSNNISITAAIPQAPLFNSVLLQLSSPLQNQTVYKLTANAVTDCQGNAIGLHNTAKAGLAEESEDQDLVINEILFNPRPTGNDYVEIYNRSQKIVDASRLYIANRNSAGALSSIKNLSEAPVYIFPGDYFVVTQDAASLQREYMVTNPQNIFALSSLPSFPDDAGTVVITNTQGDVVDEVSYSDKWHFPLISNSEGISLERINPDGPSQQATNWHSAASTAGFGTPTYQNSQFLQTTTVNATVSVRPKIFSPDNDGRDDIAVIAYELQQTGYVANVTIFDANGRMVKRLVKNDLLAQKGSWIWDGLNENGRKLPVGTYIVFTEIFNLDGKKQQFKNTLVLARNLN